MLPVYFELDCPQQAIVRGTLYERDYEATWFNPRTGEATVIGEFPNAGERAFTPPDKGELLDWVLVLDDAAQKSPPPGRLFSDTTANRSFVNLSIIRRQPWLCANS